MTCKHNAVEIELKLKEQLLSCDQDFFSPNCFLIAQRYKPHNRSEVWMSKRQTPLAGWYRKANTSKYNIQFIWHSKPW